jgi:hypothetical protein
LRSASGGQCSFCGTAVPPPTTLVTAGGMALCVCRMAASWRCPTCDRAVCEQHRDRYWPGQGRGHLRLNDAWERMLWDDTTNAAAPDVIPGAREACTVCRAERAVEQVEGYRTLSEPVPTNAYDRIVVMAGAGIWAPRLFHHGDAADILGGLVERQRGEGQEPVTVAAAWKIRAGRLHRVTRTTQARAFPLGDGGRVLLLRPEALEVAGPLSLHRESRSGLLGSMRHEVVYPGPNAIVGRDTRRRPRPPSREEALGDHADYELVWRPAGRTPSDLGLHSYWDILSPTVPVSRREQ